MEFRKVLALRGPNIWANSPVLEAWVDLQVLKETLTTQLPGFNERLLAWLPSLYTHECGEGRGGFLAHLHGGTDLAHVLEHAAIELQCLAGTPVGFGRTRQTQEPGVLKVVLKYKEEALARACLQSARELCLAAVHGRPFDAAVEIKRLRALAQDVCFGPSTGSIIEAARARGIPVRRLNSESLVQLGHGARQRRILTAETDGTGSIAEAIAQDKELTRTLLRAVGVPVPLGRPATDAADAWAAACEIGAPVVVKPRDGNQGRGVTTNLFTREQVLAAYANARTISNEVMVERFAPGSDYRVLVVGERVIAAARRDPAQVVGDGRSTIAQLIEDVNRDPRRSDGHATALSFIRLDAIALSVLQEQGYTPDSVPPSGQRVSIRTNANLSTGGTATDVTDQIHPEVAARAVEAARVVGLDIAGVDVVAQDIGRPLEEQQGVVVEVNTGPGLRMHLEPSQGTPRCVGKPIVDMLFAAGQTGRIPLIAVTGVNGKTTTACLIAHILSHARHHVGLTCSEGLFVAGRRLQPGDRTGAENARAVLLNPRVDAAVFECSRDLILNEGLGFDRCSVAVVTNIGAGDRLGLDGIATPEDLAYVKRTVVDVVLPEGAVVLNSDDRLVAAMAPFCQGQVIYFGRSGEHPTIAQHLRAGGRAAFVRDGAIVLAEGERENILAPLARVPLTRRGRVRFQVENALAAVAAAWAQGIACETIRAALASFAGDARQTPGRFNVLEADGATVVIDCGHNPMALAASIEAIDLFPHKRRATMFTTVGNCRENEVVLQGEILGRAFDRVLLYESNGTSGRLNGETTALLRRGLAPGSRVSEIVEARDEREAVAAALRALHRGDLLFMHPKDFEGTLASVERHLASMSVQAESESIENGLSEPAQVLYEPPIRQEEQVVAGRGAS